MDNNFPPVYNDSAFGPAWFVDDVVVAAKPDEEIALLGDVDLRTTAVVAQETPNPASAIPNATPVILSDSEESIAMTSYAPNRLKYHYTASADRVAVFSEIYYPDGWHASVDGEPLELFRADWTLRAALLPAGEHDVEMYFMPDSYRQGAAISRITSILLLLLLLGALAGQAIPNKARSNAKTPLNA